MPELPEVETVVRDVRPHLTGRRIATVRAGRKALRHRWSPTWGAALQGRCVETVTRRGKWIVVSLDGGAFLVFHLGMSGQLVAMSAEVPRRDHTHLVFTLDDGNELRFRDPRRFGGATLFADRAELDAFFTATRLGPEPFELRPDYWMSQLTTTKRSLKAALLDQRLVAGVGNIYADETLYEAKLPPAQRGCDTNRHEAERLRRAMVRVLNRAIEKRGSSIRDYLGGRGDKGQYQEEFRVYGRTGEPCRRCATPVACVRLAGRSTHFCPQCQESGVKGQQRTV